MQKIILDTNVIVSALIQQSYPYLILNNFIVEKKFQLCISDELMSEYYEVLFRPKFSRFRDFFFKAEAILAEIELRAVKYKPTLKLHIISDIDDNMVLELRINAKPILLLLATQQILHFLCTKIQ